MNPNMLNRRSILTGGTLISLSTLLAACVPHDITTAGDGSTGLRHAYHQQQLKQQHRQQRQ